MKTRTTIRLGVGLLVVLSVATTASAGLLQHWALDEGSGDSTNDGTTGTSTLEGQLGEFPTGGGTDYHNPTWNTAAGDKVLGAAAMNFQEDDAPGTAALYITGQYVDAGTVPSIGTGDFSVGGWFRTTYDKWQYLLAKGGSSSPGYGLAINGNQIYGFIIGGSTRLVLSHATVTGNDIDDGNWHHYTISFDRNDTARAYVDGAYVTEWGITSTNGKTVDSSAPLYLGEYRPHVYNAANGWWRGDLDDLSIWGEALSDGKAIGIYNAGTDLAYDASDVDILFDLYDDGTGTADVDGTTWYPATGLSGSAGEVIDLGGGQYALQLDDLGGGVTMVPEPSAFVLLLGALAALALRRR